MWLENTISPAAATVLRREISATGRREEKGRKAGAIRILAGSEALMRAIWPVSTSLEPVSTEDFVFFQPAGTILVLAL